MKKYVFVLFLCFVLIATACTRGESAEQTDPTEVETEPVVMESDPCVAETVCEETVPPETEPAIFSTDITYTGAYVTSEDYMPYALFTPSSAEPDTKIPLIVFLHGRGERNTIESWFMNVGMTQVMKEWSLEGFNAYVICPQLFGRWGCESWNNLVAAGHVINLLDHFVQEYAVDTDRIILAGFSSGGMGALKIAQLYPDYFCKMVVMSSPAVDEELLEQITIPTVGASEMAVSFNSFMMKAFPSVFGEKCVRIYPVKHAEVPGAAFNDDWDGNNRSDLIEWMFDDTFVWEYVSEEEEQEES